MNNTPRRDGQIILLKVAADKEILEGSIVALNSDGYAVDAEDISAKKIVGRANNSAFNLKGLSGDETVNIQRKNAFLFANATGADEIKYSHLFSECYFVDKFTVAAEKGTPERLKVGKIIELSSEGVWVEIE